MLLREAFTHCESNSRYLFPFPPYTSPVPFTHFQSPSLFPCLHNTSPVPFTPFQSPSLLPCLRSLPWSRWRSLTCLSSNQLGTSQPDGKNPKGLCTCSSTTRACSPWEVCMTGSQSNLVSNAGTLLEPAQVGSLPRWAHHKSSHHFLWKTWKECSILFLRRLKNSSLFLRRLKNSSLENLERVQYLQV